MDIIENKRLPRNFKSWLQIAKELQTEDELILLENKEKFFVQHKLNPISKSNPTDTTTFETFEGDIFTLKIRAFDEIMQLIPSKEELKQLYQTAFHEKMILNPNTNPKTEPTLIFLQSLIDLL